MQPDLQRIRWKLTRRYALISSLVLLVFGAGVYLQVADSRRQLMRNQLQQLASAAAAQMPLILHELEEYAGAKPQVKQSARDEMSVLDGQSLSPTSKRISWLNADFLELTHYGTFMPKGVRPVPVKLRNQSQYLTLSNGVSYWRPVLLRETPSSSLKLAGYISVSVSSMATDLELKRLREGLLAGGLAATLTAVLLSQWMVASSLRPIREQILRLVQFTADASHELRHPLTAIRAVIGSIREGGLIPQGSEVLAEKVGLIDQAATQMGKLVEDLLLLARLDRSVPDRSHWVVFDVVELIEDLVRLNDERARRLDMQFVLELSSEALVRGEVGRLSQLLSNLLANALQFNPPGGLIWIGVANQSRQLLIWVEDQGPGIPKDQRDQVFQRFWQASSSRTASNSGLGLAIARSIAKAHGGSLMAQTGRDGGCRMELVVPVA